MAGFGLRIARSQGMVGYSGNSAEFPIDPANSNAIFTGDPVILDSGFLDEASGNTPGPIAAAPIIGVFTGCRYVDSNGDYVFRNQWDGGANRSEVVGKVALPPHSTFYIRASVPVTQADVGTRRLLVYAAGSIQYGDSRVTLGAASATGPVQIHRLAPLPRNSWDSDEPILEVSVVAQQGTAADVA